MDIKDNASIYRNKILGIHGKIYCTGKIGVFPEKNRYLQEVKTFEDTGGVLRIRFLRGIVKNWGFPEKSRVSVGKWGFRGFLGKNSGKSRKEPGI